MALCRGSLGNLSGGVIGYQADQEVLEVGWWSGLDPHRVGLVELGTHSFGAGRPGFRASFAPGDPLGHFDEESLFDHRTGKNRGRTWKVVSFLLRVLDHSVNKPSWFKVDMEEMQQCTHTEFHCPGALRRDAGGSIWLAPWWPPAGR